MEIEYAKGDKVKVNHEGFVYTGTVVAVEKLFKWTHIHVEMQKGVTFWKFPEDIIERTGRHYANSADVDTLTEEVEDAIHIDDILEEAARKRAQEERAQQTPAPAPKQSSQNTAPVDAMPKITVEAIDDITVDPEDAEVPGTPQAATRNRAASRLQRRSQPDGEMS